MEILKTFGVGLLRKTLVDSRSLLLLLAMAFVCDHASAKLAYECREDGTAGVYWEQDFDEEGNEISYVGPINIPEKVVKDGKTYIVTEIMSNGFPECGVTSLYIPKTIKRIEDDAFLECGLLEEVIFDAEDCEYAGYIDRLMPGVWMGNGTFERCEKLRKLKICAGVKRIPGAIFKGLKQLDAIEIPETVTYIGPVAFADCSSLTSVTIPRNVTYIGDNAFKWCDKLSSVIFNAEACTYMGCYHEECFDRCENLTTVTIGENVTIIPDYAFEDCEGIKTVVIPNSVRTIGDDAFSSCSIETLTLGNSVTTIGFGAFSDNYLSSVTIPNSVTTIHSRAFDNGMDDNYKIKPLSVVFNAENCNTVINKWRHREGPDTTTIYIDPVFVSEVSSLTIGLAARNWNMSR